MRFNSRPIGMAIARICSANWSCRTAFHCAAFPVSLGANLPALELRFREARKMKITNFMLANVTAFLSE
jgi:hypothetical protein